MTHWMRLALASTLSFGLLARPALASPGPDHDEGDAEKASDEDGNGGKKGGKDKKGPDKVGPFPKDKYPKIYRYRPLTLSKNMAQVTLGLDWLPLPDPITDVTALGLDVGFGLAPTVDVHVGTGLSLNPDIAWTETLVLGVGYLANDTPDFDLAVRLDLAAGLYDGGAIGANISVPMRYLAGDIWDIHGTVGVPVYFDPDFFVGVSLNPGVGLQASGPVYLELNTTLLTFTTLEGTDPVHLGDALPLDFRFNYAIDRQWDVGAHAFMSVIWAADKQYPGIGIFGRGRF